ncbi:MAG TPA: carboxypeptidase-like regulatory domain-containing protein, partial [Ktedonobacteraceae bacterium]|nr:carboxypeptidase-like regulatory domain-containing protein [Ktedonobacteraceae bacterium]
MMRNKDIIVAILLITFLFLFPLTASAHSAGVGRISGRLLDGTKKNAPVAGQSVTLQMAQGNNSSDLTKVTTDAQGRYSFSGLNTDKTINYAIYTLYQGAQYVTDLIDLSNKPTQQINLTVYDATTSISNIAVVQASALVGKPDAQNGLLTISESFFFENLGATTYVGSLQATGSKPNALRFSLPPGARKLSLSDGFNGYSAIQVDPGFATDAAIPPGTSQFAFSFQVPYSATSYDFSYTAIYPTVYFSLLLPLDIHATSSGLNSEGPKTTQQGTFQLLDIKQLTAGNQVHAQLDGLPASKTAPTSTPSNQNYLWIVAGLLLMLAIIAVTSFLYRATHRQSPTRQKRTSSSRAGSHKQKARSQSTANTTRKKEVASQDRQQALLQELLELDTAYEAGNIKKATYQERRAKTKAELRALMSAETQKAGKGKS